MDSQPSVSVRIPPAAGPRAAPSTPAVAQVRTARASEPSIAVRRSSAAQTSSAPPTAWTQRAPTSTPNDGARPQASEAAANTSVPRTKAGTGRPPRGVGGRHGRGGEREVVRGEHPRDLRDLDVELPQDVRAARA